MKQKLIAEQECFDEIIDLLESNGNPVQGKRWICNKEGYHAFMTQPIDFELIFEHYTPTDEVIFDRDYGWIRTAREWLTICHTGSD